MLSFSPSPIKEKYLHPPAAPIALWIPLLNHLHLNKAAMEPVHNEVKDVVFHIEQKESKKVNL